MAPLLPIYPSSGVRLFCIFRTCSLVRSLHLSLFSLLSLLSRASPCPVSTMHEHSIPVPPSLAKNGSLHPMFAPALLLSRSTQTKKRTWVTIVAFLLPLFVFTSSPIIRLSQLPSGSSTSTHPPTTRSRLPDHSLPTSMKISSRTSSESTRPSTRTILTSTSTFCVLSRG